MERDIINEIKNNLNGVLDNIKQSIPQLSIDCVIFGFHNNELKVLLSKFSNLELWGLQGGYVFQNEDIDAAALRILEERTGLNNIFLEQFHTFGKANRPTFDVLKQVFEELSIDIEDVPFFKQRFVSIGYYSLVDFTKVTPKVGLFAERSEWFDIHSLPILVFDHADVIKKALEMMPHSLDYHLLGFNLLPETFTMKELQNLYETILGEKLRRNNFQEKILNMNILERLEKQFTGKAHKAPYLYRYKKDV